jgi:hypothetical protein
VRLHHFLRFIFIRAIDARDRLQKRVVPHRLVEVHCVQDWRVESCQQLLSDYQYLRPLTDLGEALPNLLFPGGFQVPLLETRRIIVVARIDDLRIFLRQDRIESFFVESTRLTIDADEKCLVTQRLYVLAVVVGDILRDLFDTILSLQEILQVHRAIKDFV